MIQVLFLIRPDLFRIRAGDTIQISSLKKALEGLGVKIWLDSNIVNAEKFDLVHCFNILRVGVSFPQCKRVKELGKPLIFTPIYWNLEEYLTHERPELQEWWARSQCKRRELLKLVDLLAPNSFKELKQIKLDFGLDLPGKIIYNGVDPVFLRANNENERTIPLLSVGRIHQRKNQLQLIKALKGCGIPLLLIGDINDPNYYRQCLDTGGEMVTIKKGVQQKELISIYWNTKVHILASWYDTPGLVNLEAGLAGCNLVTTDRGTANEYLEDYAFYCQPDDPEDIRKKIIDAYKRPLSDELSHHILHRFTWDNIARETYNIYSEFLSQFI